MAGYRAVTILVEDDIMRQFKKACALREKTIKEIVNFLMKQFIEESQQEATSGE